MCQAPPPVLNASESKPNQKPAAAAIQTNATEMFVAPLLITSQAVVPPLSRLQPASRAHNLHPLKFFGILETSAVELDILNVKSIDFDNYLEPLERLDVCLSDLDDCMITVNDLTNTGNNINLLPDVIAQKFKFWKPARRTRPTEQSEDGSNKAFQNNTRSTSSLIPLSASTQFRLDNDLILFQMPDAPASAPRIFVPESLRCRFINLIKLMHSHPNKMVARARRSLWWPFMNTEPLREHRQCKTCMESSPSNPPDNPLVHEPALYPFQQISTFFKETFYSCSNIHGTST